MHWPKLLIFAACIGGCTNLPISSQNFRILSRNVNLWSAVTDANAEMINRDMSLSVIVSSADGEISPQFFVSNSTLSATSAPYFQTLPETSRDVCIVLYRYDIPSPPNSTTCYDLASIGKAVRSNTRAIAINSANIARLQSRLASLEVVVAENTAKIDLGAEATLQTFQMAATNGNILVAQNEFFDSVRLASQQIENKVNQIDARFTGFQNAVTSQMNTLNVNVTRLRADIARLAAQ